MSKALLILFFLMIGVTVFVMSEIRDETSSSLYSAGLISTSPITPNVEISAYN
ncbi:hypothetical protein [Alkalihalophilus marmarensis]|uniref:hypothetical protein n=1 Tax=Alkalihalophilus marmarensis TaxID=521377 RepID=UPI002DB88126|nr:hypothetical protein [Alkalihalophilus marmarensis]MEC2070927.1 hypothetical protein [Alkalihalophilus marmarensis]